MITRRQLLIGSTGIAAATTAGFLGYAYHKGWVGFGPYGMPPVALAPVPGVTQGGKPVPGVDASTRGQSLTLLNIWASWCPYCRSEHHLLMELALDPRVTLIGVVGDDSETKVAAYLKGAGNPFAQLSVDHKRVVLRGLRQRGYPSTYLLRPDGSVIYKHPGALTEDVIASQLEPAIARASKPA